MKKLVFLMLATLWAVTSWGGVTPSNGGSYVVACLDAHKFLSTTTYNVNDNANISLQEADKATTFTFIQEEGQTTWKLKATVDGADKYVAQGTYNWSCVLKDNASDAIAWTIEAVDGGTGHYRFKKGDNAYLAPNTNYDNNCCVFDNKGANDAHNVFVVCASTDAFDAEMAKLELEAAITAVQAYETGTLIGQYDATKLQTAITAAQTACNAADATVASLSEAKTALEAAAAAAMNMPDANKYYFIRSAYAGFAQNQNGATKAMCADGTDLNWKTEAECERGMYWKFIPVDGGGYQMQNIYNGTYAVTNDQGYTMGETPATVTLNMIGKHEFNLLISGKQDMHTGGHNNGSGVSGYVVAFNAGLDGGSAWYINEASKQEQNVNYTFNVTGCAEGRVVCGGTEYEAGTHSLPFFSQFTAKPVSGYACDIVFDMATNTVTARYAEPLTPNLPGDLYIKVGEQTTTITPATSADDNDHWYIIEQDKGKDDNERGIWTPIYNNGTQLKRAARTVTVDGATVEGNRKFLVRFFSAGYSNAYYMQTGMNGQFISAAKETPDNNADVTVTGPFDKRMFLFYPISETQLFGWSLTSDGTSFTKTVDNQGAGEANAADGNRLVFWAAGELKSAGDKANNVWRIKPVELQTRVSYTLAKDYGTLILPFDWTAPEGWTVYSCNGKEGNTLSLEEVTAPAANTPYIIGGTNHDAQTFQGTVVTTTDALTAGYLTGVYAQTPAPDNSFVLQEQQGVLGFYQVQDTKPTVGANRCYLTLPADAAGVKALFFGTATGIEEVNGQQTTDNATVYDLAGRRVSKPQHGIYIINGKKVIR